jgi:hypothetical protein
MSDGKELNKHLDTFDRLLSFFRWDADTPVKRQRLDELYAAVNYVRDRLVKQESPPSLLPDGDEVESKIEAHMYPGTRSLETVRFQETWASGFRACYLWLRERLAERAESPLTAPDMVDRETFKTVITCWTNDRELLHAFMDLSTFEEIKRAQEYREQVRRGSLQPDVDATRVTLTTSDESGEGAE